MFKQILFFQLLLCSVSLSAQNLVEHEKAMHYLKTRGEFYFKFDVKEPSARTLKKIVSLDHYVDINWCYAYANIQQYLQMRDLKIDFFVQTPPSLAHKPMMAKKTGEVTEWNCYPTYDQYVEIMQEFATKYPELCKLKKIGTSNEGRDLLFVKISDNVDEEEAEPDFMYSSSMHGDELTGYVLMLRLIDYLLTNYESDDRIRDLVNTTEIWINPLANPDGAYAISNESIEGATRFNKSNGFTAVDLNRNFPDPRSGEHPDGNSLQKENAVMIAFMEKHNFVLSANIHGGTELINYPWDTWTALHADDVWYKRLSRAYADTAQSYSKSDYMIEYDNGITNGADWYIVAGGRQDYTNYYLNGREVTIEISDTKAPDESKLGYYWEANYRSFLNYIDAVHYGIGGLITDEDTMKPLRAKIEVEGHDFDNSFVFSEQGNGNYHRMIAPNTYTLLVTKAGYEDKRIEGVVVEWDKLTSVNVRLKNLHVGSESMTLNTGIAGAYVVNDTNVGEAIVRFSLSSESELSLSLFDFSGRKHFYEKKSFGSGEHEFSIDSANLSPGVYVCSLRMLGESKHIKVMIVK